MKHLGLIGYPLSHSFSKKYFTEKFEKEGISGYQYELFPIANIDLLPKLLKENPDLVGLNVTIPYKEQVIPYLDDIEASAEKVGAVNTIRINDRKLIGYNSDVYGFGGSLKQFILKAEKKDIKKALILGTGGASKAVAFVLEQMGMEYNFVSRKKSKNKFITYQDIDEDLINEIQLIVNTTPLGMSPHLDTAPDIPYEYLNDNHLLFDLVYNPEKTVFLIRGEQKGAHIQNGLEMLIGQAEKSWEIWNNKYTIKQS